MPDIFHQKKIKKMITTIVILALLGMVFLGLLVHFRHMLRLDIFLSRDLQAEGDTPERKTALYHFFYFISLFGKPVIAAITITAITIEFIIAKYYREAVYTLLTPISVLVNLVVKYFVNRPRPAEPFVSVLDREAYTSFPSGHVTFYTVFFGFLIVAMFFTPRIPKVVRLIVQIISGALIILISFSRIYLGAHWMTDTLGGYCLGGLLLIALLYFYLKPLPGQTK